MQNLISIYKPVGLTPLEVIISITQKFPELKARKITYAGRLDPLAHGLLLLLSDNEIKKKAYYLSLKKTYEFKVVFGLKTDTYDLLGYLQDIKIKNPETNVNLFVNKFVKNFLGKYIQEYPPSSSTTVKRTPLFWWVKNDKLSEITIPKHEIEIFNFKLTSLGEIEMKKLKQKTKKEFALVHGNFRQEMILERWQQLFSKTNTSEKCITAKFRIECSSGTYIRGLVDQMGKELGCGAVAIDIFRTDIGTYSLKNALRL